MEKSKKKSNTLIKRKNLILKIKQVGIKRISPDAVCLLEKSLENNLSIIIERLKEEITIKGRKTVKKQDIKKVFSENNQKDNQEFWEI